MQKSERGDKTLEHKRYSSPSYYRSSLHTNSSMVNWWWAADGLEHTTQQSASLEGLVVGHRDVVCAVDLRGETDVRTILPDRFVPEDTQGPNQNRSIHLAGRSHTSSTSS